MPLMAKGILLLGLVFISLLGILALPGPASAGDRISYPGLERLTFRQGPLRLEPGQSRQTVDLAGQAPPKDGFLTRFSYSLVYADSGKPVATNVVHLHHSTWGLGGKSAISAGAELTVWQFPRNFGLGVTQGRPWTLIYMLHNLTAIPAKVFLRWHVDFVPAQSAAGRRMKDLDFSVVRVVQKPYWNPVFDALRDQGKDGRLVAPGQLKHSDYHSVLRQGRRGLSWTVPESVTLVFTTAHMHPGGLFSDLWVRRRGQTKLLFRSRAKYFGNQGKPSLNMTQTETPANWRIKLKAGDLVFTTTTVDTATASWYDTMGTFPLLYHVGHDAGGVDPFSRGARWPVSGPLNHGPLPISSVSGGAPSALPDPRSLPEGPRVTGPVAIKNFRYQLGNLEGTGLTSLPPVVERGQRLTFVNLDYSSYKAEKIYTAHSVSACRAPCNSSAGLAYPLSDSPASTGFDSGQLGVGPPMDQPGLAQRATWQTPANLPEGTYTFFCRLHPFMRGAFRVAAPARRAWSSGWSVLPPGASSG